MRKFIGIILLTVSAWGLLFCGYADHITSEDTLCEAVNKLDMTSLITAELDDNEQFVGEMLQREEFQDIITEYTNGFVHYLLTGEGTVNIPDEKWQTLLHHYTDDFFNEFPELSFLPADRIMEILINNIDLNQMLPDYETLKAHVPLRPLELLLTVTDPMVIAAFGVIGLVGIFLLVGTHKVLTGLGIAGIVSGLTALLASQTTDFIMGMAQMADYQMLRPMLSDLLRRLMPFGVITLVAGLILFVLGVWYEKKVSVL